MITAKKAKEFKNFLIKNETKLINSNSFKDNNSLSYAEKQTIYGRNIKAILLIKRMINEFIE